MLRIMLSTSADSESRGSFCMLSAEQNEGRPSPFPPAASTSSVVFSTDHGFKCIVSSSGDTYLTFTMHGCLFALMY